MNAKKKSICFVVSSPFTAKAFLLNHFKVLSKHFDIYLVANFEKLDITMFSDTPIKGIKNINIFRDINVIKDIKALLSLWLYLRKMKFDAVHTVTPKAGLLGGLASKLAGINMRVHIFTGQVWHTKTGVFKKILKFLDKVIVWNASDILVDGESQRQFLIQNSILTPNNSFVLGKGSISGVDTDRFIPNKTIRNEIRRELNIKHDEIVYMFLGRMNKDKGIHELAKAFNQLQLQNPKAFLLLVGGDEENMTSVLHQEVKNINRVIFYGITPTPERLIQACDVFCLPSYREGFGTSIIEASLLAKPIICSDTYGLMETIIENKTGLRHNVADVDSLYLQMYKLVNNEKLRESLGIEGRQYVLNHFSANAISKKWLEFYLHKIQ